MFKFLKEKLKQAVSIFSKKVEQEAEIKKEVKEEVVEAVPEISKEPVSIKKKAEEVFEEEAKEEPEAEAEFAESEEAKDKELEEEIVETEAKEIKTELEQEMHELKEEEEKEEREESREEKETEVMFEEKPVENEILDFKEKLRTEKKEEIVKEGEEKKRKEEFEKAPAPPEEKPEKSSFFKKLFGRKEKKEEELSIKAEEKKPERTIERERKPSFEVKNEPEVAQISQVEEEKEEPAEKKGFFKKIKETFTTVKLSDEKFEKLFWDLEVVLMENNVAIEVIEKIKADLKADLTTGKISRKGVDELIEDSLRESVKSLFIGKRFNLVEEARKKKEKPYIITFIGVNGSGKTTTMAKIAYLLMKNKLSVVFAASDTFRAAAIQQLEEHANRLGVKMIKHDYESDPTAVAFDAIKHAKAKGIDVVLIDTAGRLHSNDNLMNELKKLVRVNKPDLKIFVGESITGNDCVEQAKLFNETVGIDAIILAKADVDEKGGAAVSVSYVSQKPIIYLGTGQRYEDLIEFKPEIIIKNIGL